MKFVKIIKIIEFKKIEFSFFCQKNFGGIKFIQGEKQNLAIKEEKENQLSKLFDLFFISSLNEFYLKKPKFISSIKIEI